MREFNNDNKNGHKGEIFAMEFVHSYYEPEYKKIYGEEASVRTNYDDWLSEEGKTAQKSGRDFIIDFISSPENSSTIPAQVKTRMVEQEYGDMILNIADFYDSECKLDNSYTINGLIMYVLYNFKKIYVINNTKQKEFVNFYTGLQNFWNGADLIQKAKLQGKDRMIDYIHYLGVKYKVMVQKTRGVYGDVWWSASVFVPMNILTERYKVNIYEYKRQPDGVFKMINKKGTC